MLMTNTSNASRLQYPAPDNQHDALDMSNPLRGIVLCCTSIAPEKRIALSSQAEQMGAQHKYDLTSEVTHLIVGEYNTPKYRYVAKERPDVKIMKPEWIEAVRKLWINDEYIDLQALEIEYTLPTFSQLKICMTGFEDPQERQQIIDLIRNNGGEYSGDLTKQITHLLAYRPDGAKYRHAQSWGTQIVAIEWLKESAERGMILSEEYYRLDMVSEERGKGAWIKHQPPKSPGKHPRAADASSEESRKKIRRTMSSKLNGQSDSIWGDIVRGVTPAQDGKNEPWKIPDAKNTNNKPSVAAIMGEDIPLQYNVQPVESTGLFAGCQVHIHGFNTRNEGVLKKYLVSNEAEVCQSIEDLLLGSSATLYLIVPHTMSSDELPKLPETSRPIHMVTEFWIERCLEAKTFINPKDYILGLPFKVVPIPGFEQLTVCSTGFDGLQLLHISKAIPILGAVYSEVFSQQASVLICNPERPIRLEKVTLANEWRIPTVSTSWLLDAIIQGTSQKYKAHLQRLRLPRKAAAEEMEPPRNDLDFSERDLRRTKSVDHVSKQQLSSARRPAQASGLDRTAFDKDRPFIIKKESSSLPYDHTPVVALAPVHQIPATKVLTDISTNPPCKASLSPKRSSVLTMTTSIPQEVFSTALSSLLAKSKSIVLQQDGQDSGEGVEGLRRKREKGRILGRAASNVSTGSATFSRASSVDSTASTGQAVLWNTKTLSGEARGISRSHNPLFVDENIHDESQPPQTQRVQYEDTESADFKQQVLAKMTGAKIQRKEREIVATVASLDDAPRARTLRGRSSVGIPGFRQV